MFKRITTILLVMLFSILTYGCVQKQIEYVPQIIEKEVYLPYIPNIPEIECKFTGDETEVMKQMLECIAAHRKVYNTLKLQSYKNPEEKNYGINNSK